MSITYYLYTGQQLLETRVGTTSDTPQTAAIQYQYVWSPTGLNVPILRDTYADGAVVSADRLYYLTDANNNVTAVTDDTGAVQERYSYDAYGNATIYDADWVERSSSSVNNTLLFAGMFVDPTTGLYYARARWFNPSTGAFITQDPAQAETNLYGYAGNDPISESDPTGLAVTVGYPSTTPTCDPAAGTYSNYNYVKSEVIAGGLATSAKHMEGTQYSPNPSVFSALDALLTGGSPLTAQSFSADTTAWGVNSSTFLGASVEGGYGTYTGAAQAMAGTVTRSGGTVVVPGVGTVTVTVNPQDGSTKTSVAANGPPLGVPGAGGSASGGIGISRTPTTNEYYAKGNVSVDSNPARFESSTATTTVRMGPTPAPNPLDSTLHSMPQLSNAPIQYSVPSTGDAIADRNNLIKQMMKPSNATAPQLNATCNLAEMSEPRPAPAAPPPASPAPRTWTGWFWSFFGY
jgi:RHS repeat-associated protein